MDETNQWIETLDKLKKLWETNAYPSLYPLYKLAKKRGLNVKVKEVDEWLKKQPSQSLLQAKKEPFLVKGTFKNATRPFERMYLDISDHSAHGSTPGDYYYALVIIDSYTRKAWSEPMKTKEITDFLPAYERLIKKIGENPALLFMDREGASFKLSKEEKDRRKKEKKKRGRAAVPEEQHLTPEADSLFEKHVKDSGTILKRKQGRNDLAPIDSFMYVLSQAISKMRIERNLPEGSWATLMQEAIPLLNERAMKSLDGSSPNEVKESIESNSPEEKDLAFKVLT